MDRRWKTNVVSLTSSVMAVMHPWLKPMDKAYRPSPDHLYQFDGLIIRGSPPF